MKRQLAHAIVDFLSLSKDVSTGVNWERFGEHEWQRALPWLHNTGLALYLLNKLNTENVAGKVPSSILRALEENLAANKKRVFRLIRQFELLNRAFETAGVVYAAVKGLSLVPEFCPQPWLRHQSDLDYIVDDVSLADARRVLEAAGYSLSACSARDYVYSAPPTDFVPTVSDQYNPDAPYPVELYLSLWHRNVPGIVPMESRFSYASTVARQYERLPYSGLRDEDHFLFQVTHIFYHIATYWVRLSWIYEIAYFLERRREDASLWARFEERTDRDPVLREVTVLVALLARELFAAPLPPTLERCQLPLSVRVWVQKYSWAWALGRNHVHDFSILPTAKLALFLLQNYTPQAKRFVWSRLFAPPRLADVVRNLKTRPSRILDRNFLRRERIARRILFHLAANLRYACEWPRWVYLNKTAERLLTA